MKNFLLRNVDDDLWYRVKARAARDRISIRLLLLQFLRAYVAGRT